MTEKLSDSDLLALPTAETSEGGHRDFSGGFRIAWDPGYRMVKVTITGGGALIDERRIDPDDTVWEVDAGTGTHYVVGTITVFFDEAATHGQLRGTKMVFDSGGSKYKFGGTIGKW